MKLQLEDDDVQAIARAVVALLRPSAVTGDQPKPLRCFGIPVRTLRRAIRDGELRGWKVGREYQAVDADVDAWRAARRVTPKGSAAKPKGKPQSAAERAIERSRAAGGLRAIAGGGS